MACRWYYTILVYSVLCCLWYVWITVSCNIGNFAPVFLLWYGLCPHQRQCVTLWPADHWWSLISYPASHFSWCGHWQSGIWNYHLNCLLVTTIEYYLVCSPSLCISEFLTFSESWQCVCESWRYSVYFLWGRELCYLVIMSVGDSRILINTVTGEFHYLTKYRISLISAITAWLVTQVSEW